jgi:hypothetical protein
MEQDPWDKGRDQAGQPAPAVALTWKREMLVSDQVRDAPVVGEAREVAVEEAAAADAAEAV